MGDLDVVTSVGSGRRRRQLAQAFQAHHQQVASRFESKFTRADSGALLQRLARALNT